MFEDLLLDIRSLGRQIEVLDNMLNDTAYYSPPCSPSNCNTFHLVLEVLEKVLV